ncbi:MAG: HAMP domain-containing sensor histidine kinase [Patescibacteria group bacterium]|nr:HAMP domain-containing sensor histidine kinase [Patescibacteria group bacterium]
MIFRWPIRAKALIGLGLLVLAVGALARNALYTTYAYRDLVKSLSTRVAELPVAAELARHVGDLRITLSELRGLRAATFPGTLADRMPLRVRMVRDQFRLQLDQVEKTLARYRTRLESKLGNDSQMADNQREWRTVAKINAALDRVHEAEQAGDWMLDDVRIGRLDAELEYLQSLSGELPSHLHEKLEGFADDVRVQYRALIVGTWVTTISAALLFALFVQLFYRWIVRPLRVLIDGSRRVAAGCFNHRIRLNTADEMAELAGAMNDMTARFQAIRDDLDRQVQERTKQVVRSERLASVGFLAAGVAHEINNPLASIAICAESLEERVSEALGSREPVDPEQHAVIADYLRMVQSEAFRCKEITEKLLDFSRVGEVSRQEAELGELIQDVIDMVRHLGRYQSKEVQFAPGEAVFCRVNPREIKQVVLNLLTNALDSIDDDGWVHIAVTACDGTAEIEFRDNGYGIEPEVIEHIFEPFFTRRRQGQGTGLGLSITYRIVADHGGELEAYSPGAGQGATFRVRLPLAGQAARGESYREAA